MKNAFRQAKSRQNIERSISFDINSFIQDQSSLFGEMKSLGDVSISESWNSIVQSRLDSAYSSQRPKEMSFVKADLESMAHELEWIRDFVFNKQGTNEQNNASE